MCSGCSGDYAGGFESDDPGDGVFDSSGIPSSASLHEEPETGLGGWRGQGAEGFPVQEDGAENCEILVSGTRIIEIRVIPVKSRDNDQQRRIRVAGPTVAGKQSRAASAKYYQTRQPQESPKADHERAMRHLRISRSIAGACKSKFAGWLGQARRLLGKCAP